MQMKNGILKITVTVFVLMGQAAHADWIQSVGIGQKSSNLGGAVTATADDWDAYYTNPAGAANFRRPFIGGGVKSFDSRNLKFNDSTGSHDVRSTLKESELAVIPGAAGYYPINDSLTVGLGFGAPFAIAGDWNNDSGIHRFNMTDQSLIVTDLSPLIAYQVSDKLNVGFALNIAAFKHLRTSSLFGDNFLGGGADGNPDGVISLNTHENATLPVPPFDEFDPSFDEIGYTIGAQFKASDRLSLGIVYREEMPTTFEGTVSTNLTGTTLTDEFSVDLHMPRHLQLGTYYQATSRLGISTDVRWTNWSDAKGIGSPLNVRFQNGTILGLSGLQVNYDANDTISIHLGASYKLDDRWTLQGGYVYDPSPFDDKNVDILSYSSDRHILSLGAVYDARERDTGKGWEFTGGLQALIYEDRNIAAGESSNLGGLSSATFAGPGVVGFTSNTDRFKYGGYLWTAGLSASYRF
jgi:long-chain fatty acid transport protein